MKDIVIDEYVVGLLYGDGSMHLKDGKEQYFFSTTNAQIASRVRKEFDNLGLKYYKVIRDHNTDDKENYEILDIVATTNKHTISVLKSNHVISNDVEKRMRNSGEFLRGYLETKGTLFEHMSKNNTAWRVSFSGNKDDIYYLKDFLDNRLNVRTSSIHQRREREDLGVISESYRLPIQNRDGVSKIVEYIDGEDMSAYLKDKVESFKDFHQSTPFNRKAKVFKHYKSATQYMAREMGIIVNGKRNDIRPNGWRLIYLWNEKEINTVIFNGYEVAYKHISELYKKTTGFEPPMVDED